MLQNLQELTESLDYVLGIDRSLPWYIVGVEEATGIEEGRHHLLFPNGVDFGLDRLRLALCSRCLDCCFISGM